MEESTINQRIKTLLDHFDKGNKLAFSKRVGMSNQGIGEIVGDRQSNPSYPNLRKIAAALPQVRTEWLLLGEGEMLKTPPQNAEAPKILSYNPPGLFPKEAPLPGFTPAETTELHGQLIQTRLPLGMGTPKPAPKQLPGQDFIETVARHDEAILQLTQQLAELRERVEKG